MFPVAGDVMQDPTHPGTELERQSPGNVAAGQVVPWCCTLHGSQMTCERMGQGGQGNMEEEGRGETEEGEGEQHVS